MVRSVAPLLLAVPASAFSWTIDFSQSDGKITLAVVFTFAIVIVSLYAFCVYYCTRLPDSVVLDRMAAVRAARVTSGKFRPLTATLSDFHSVCRFVVSHR